MEVKIRPRTHQCTCDSLDTGEHDFGTAKSCNNDPAPVLGLSFMTTNMTI